MHLLGDTVRCYQCSSAEDQRGEDNCGAYKKFDKKNHIAIDCNSDESHMPGSFCMKVTQQSPKGFICKYPLIHSASFLFMSILNLLRGWPMAPSNSALRFCG